MIPTTKIRMPIACKQSPRDLATTALANNDVTLSINS